MAVFVLDVYMEKLSEKIKGVTSQYSLFNTNYLIFQCRNSKKLIHPHQVECSCTLETAMAVFLLDAYIEKLSKGKKKEPREVITVCLRSDSLLTMLMNLVGRTMRTVILH